jgi:hypothetical protein
MNNLHKTSLYVVLFLGVLGLLDFGRLLFVQSCRSRNFGEAQQCEVLLNKKFKENHKYDNLTTRVDVGAIRVVVLIRGTVESTDVFSKLKQELFAMLEERHGVKLVWLPLKDGKDTTLIVPEIPTWQHLFERRLIIVGYIGTGSSRISGSSLNIEQTNFPTTGF